MKLNRVEVYQSDGENYVISDIIEFRAGHSLSVRQVKRWPHVRNCAYALIMRGNANSDCSNFMPRTIKRFVPYLEG